MSSVTPSLTSQDDGTVLNNPMGGGGVGETLVAGGARPSPSPATSPAANLVVGRGHVSLWTSLVVGRGHVSLNWPI
jgi:hypothetical protein